MEDNNRYDIMLGIATALDVILSFVAMAKMPIVGCIGLVLTFLNCAVNGKQ